jgi:1,4-dihydroxy-2-naphthoyl-CoA synthase
VPSDSATTWPVDLTLADGSEATATAVIAGAAANPAAAATLTQVLRTTESLDVVDALRVESLAYSMLLAGQEFRGWLESRAVPRARYEEPEQVVVTERSGGVLHVALNRPHVHNAFNAAMRDALAEAFTLARTDYSVGTVELTGNGPSFCSGGDLSEFGTTDDPVRAHFIRTARSAGAAMHELHDRLTVHVHGSCIGAGVELPAFARRVVAAENATFRLPEIGMGLIPGAGGTVSLPRRIGRERTLLLALSGIALSAADALDWGLVDAVG